MASAATQIAALTQSYTHVQSDEVRRLRTQNAEQAREINLQAQEIVQLRQENWILGNDQLECRICLE